MLTVVSLIAPIFALIALGTGAVRFGLLAQPAAEALTGFVFKVAVPVLMFRTVATADFGDTNPLFLWVSYFAGVVPAFAVGMLAARRLAGADRRGAVIGGVSGSFSNLIFVGIPLIEQTLGRPGLDVLALILAIHLPAMMTASTLLLEHAAVRDAQAKGAEAREVSLPGTLRQVGRNLLRNPLVIGIFAGLLWHLTGLPIGEPFGEVVDLLAGTAGPLALFALGMSLPRYRLGGTWSATLLIAATTLLVQPLLVWIVGSALLPPVWVAVAVLGAACPVGVNAYLFATYFRTGEGLAASAIVVTTVVSALTLTGWLALMV